MTVHNPDESAPIDRYDVASRLLDAAGQAALKGRYDRAQVHATRALVHAVLALVDTLASPRHNPINPGGDPYGDR